MSNSINELKEAIKVTRGHIYLLKLGRRTPVTVSHDIHLLSRYTEIFENNEKLLKEKAPQ